MSIEPLLLRMAGGGAERKRDTPPVAEGNRLLGPATTAPALARAANDGPLEIRRPETDRDLASNVFMYVSTYPGEGTTYCCLRSAQNLIGYLGQAPIVVVDMNLQHPDISERVGDPEDGWGDLVDAQRAHVPLTQLCVRYPEHENLWILPIGSRHRDSGALRLVRMFPELVDRAKREFDAGLVLLDAGPIFQSSHSLVLSRLVDGVVFVIEAGRTRRQVVNLALEQLKRSRAHVLGAIMNKRRMAIPPWLYRRLF